ncbi:MAG: hypothetical protein WD767_14020 [Alphaproteobacteria bacterium]
MKNNRFAAVMLAAVLLAGSPALAADESPKKDPQALVSEGMQNLMQAMEMLLLSIPQFEAPFMNENGDIIIRRKNPDGAPRNREEAAPNGNDNDNRKAI